MIVGPRVERRQIRAHYDLATPFYRALWGAHIHHGLWERDESPVAAQVRLVERLADAAALAPGCLVLDVGCGMGASAIRLARTRHCTVLGLTLSPLQRSWAAAAALLSGAGARTRFICADAERIELPADSFDVVWSIECTEHLFDKPGFFRRAAGWLRPGGRVAVCAWLAAPGPHTPRTHRQVREVCAGFLCPSLGSADDYRRWLAKTGFQLEHDADLTDRVAPTWEVCQRRVRRSGTRLLAGLLAPESVRRFLDGFATLHAAYADGAMRYGCFVARRPVSPQDGRPPATSGDTPRHAVRQAAEPRPGSVRTHA